MPAPYPNWPARIGLTVCCALLAACGAAPTGSAPPPSTVPAATLPSLPPPPSPTIVAPMATAAPATVERLPANRPWFLRDGVALALDGAGAEQRLEPPVRAALQRAPLPPLLLVESPPDAPAVIDTNGWRTTTFSLPGASDVQSFVASREGRLLAFVASFPATTGQRDERRLIVADLTTGELSAPLGAEAVGAAEELAWLEPIGWDGEVLYGAALLSATTSFWRIDTASPTATPEQLLVIGETAFPDGWRLAAGGTTLAYVGNLYKRELRLRDLRNEAEVIVSAAGAGPYALSADGARLAFVQATPAGRYDLMLYEASAGSAMPLLTGLGADLAAADGSVALRWFDGGRQLLVRTPRATTVLSLDAGGEIERQVELPAATPFWHDSQEILILGFGAPDAPLRTSSLAVAELGTIPDAYWPALVYTP